MSFSVSIVIPNYNGATILPECLSALELALDQAQISDYEIIISDDASTDESCTLLKNNFPNVSLIEARQNRGFAVNINRGIKKAQKEWVLCLNSDVLLFPNYFLKLEEYLNIDNLFGLMGGIQDPSGKLTDASKWPGLSKSSIRSNTNFIDSENIKKPLPSLFLSGANALIKKDALQEFDGFCELFSPYYSEDVDLGLRAWRSGMGCYYVPESTCVHNISSTIKKQPGKKVKEIAIRNKFLLHYLHLDDKGLKKFLFQQKLKRSIEVGEKARLKKTGLNLFYSISHQAKNEKENRKREYKFSLTEVRESILEKMSCEEIKKF